MIAFDWPGMVPCSYFLNGNCRKMDHNCKWSHGEQVRLSELREWEAPDWTGVGNPGSLVLVQQGRKGVWQRARVQGREEELLILQLEAGSNKGGFDRPAIDVENSLG